VAAGLSYMPGGPFTAAPLAMTTGKISWNKKIKPDENMIELAEDEETPRAFGSAVMIVGDGPAPDVASLKKKAPVVAPKPEPDPDILSFDAGKGDQQGPLPAVVGLTRTIH